MLLIITPALISILQPHIHLIPYSRLPCCIHMPWHYLSRFFLHVLGLWCHIMWPVMWLQCHMPLHHPKEKEKKRKRKLLVFKYPITHLCRWPVVYGPNQSTPSWQHNLCTICWQPLHTLSSVQSWSHSCQIFWSKQNTRISLLQILLV